MKMRSLIAPRRFFRSILFSACIVTEEISTLSEHQVIEALISQGTNNSVIFQPRP